MALNIIGTPTKFKVLDGVGSISLKLVTDAVAQVTSQVHNNNTATAGGSSTLTIASGSVGTLYPNQEYVHVTGGAIGGGNLVQKIIGTNTSSTIIIDGFPFTAAIAIGSPVAAKLMYRIPLNVHAKSVKLTNITSSIQFETSPNYDFGSALRTDTTGALTVVNKSLYIFSTYLIVNPDLLPTSSNFSLEVSF